MALRQLDYQILLDTVGGEDVDLLKILLQRLGPLRGCDQQLAGLFLAQAFKLLERAGPGRAVVPAVLQVRHPVQPIAGS